MLITYRPKIHYYNLKETSLCKKAVEGLDFYYESPSSLYHEGFLFGQRKLKVVVQMVVVVVELVQLEMVQLEMVQVQLVQVGVVVFEMSQVAIVDQRYSLHKEMHNYNFVILIWNLIEVHHFGSQCWHCS